MFQSPIRGKVDVIIMTYQERLTEFQSPIRGKVENPYSSKWQIAKMFQSPIRGKVEEFESTPDEMYRFIMFQSPIRGKVGRFCIAHFLPSSFSFNPL